MIDFYLMKGEGCINDNQYYSTNKINGKSSVLNPGKPRDWISLNVQQIISFILRPDTDHQQSSMKVMHVTEVTSFLDTSQKNVDISIIESTCFNGHLLNYFNDNTEREKSKYPILMSTSNHISSTLLKIVFFVTVLIWLSV